MLNLQGHTAPDKKPFLSSLCNAAALIHFLSNGVFFIVLSRFSQNDKTIQARFVLSLGAYICAHY